MEGDKLIAFLALVEASQYFLGEISYPSELAIPQNQLSSPDSSELARPSRFERDRRCRFRASIAKAVTKEDRNISMVECLSRIDAQLNLVTLLGLLLYSIFANSCILLTSMDHQWTSVD